MRSVYFLHEKVMRSVCFLYEKVKRSVYFLHEKEVLKSVALAGEGRFNVW